MRLSVVIPAFNEELTIRQIVARVLDVPIDKQIVIVDDASTDGTGRILSELAATFPGAVEVYRHARNQGKGRAIQTALSHVRGDVVVIQDADLEYQPEDYPPALGLIESGLADAVYGSRFLGPHRVFLFWHLVANKVLTVLANVMTSAALTDMETGFKMIRADVLDELKIQSFTFDFEVEVTVKLFRRGYRVFEIPITYAGRDYAEGKKITWRDGVRAVGALVRWGLLTRHVRASRSYRMPHVSTSSSSSAAARWAGH